MSLDCFKINDLSFDYPDGTSVLDKVSISILKGEFVCVLGGNGTGKTTFLKLLNRLLKPTAGSITLQGEDIRRIPKDQFFSRVATVFQNPEDQLFAPTVKEDVAFGPVNMGLSDEDVRKRTYDALTAVEMEQYADKAIHNLSFGQKKRACLAGVLSMSPEVMLLDEPASCLDPHGVNRIMQLLLDLNREKGITMIMSTHLVDLVPLFADRVIVFHEGTIICAGTPEQVFARPELLRDANLEIPGMGRLFEMMQKRDGLKIDRMPLTISEARNAINNIMAENDRSGRLYEDWIHSRIYR